jgi:hypothetical protein
MRQAPSSVNSNDRRSCDLWPWQLARATFWRIPGPAMVGSYPPQHAAFWQGLDACRERMAWVVRG